MSNLVLCAAPFSPKNNLSENNNRSHIDKPRNHTLKNRQVQNSKINDAIARIHQSPEVGEELNNFNPPPPPSSIGVLKTEESIPNTQHIRVNTSELTGDGLANTGPPEGEHYDDLNITDNNEYYKKVVPMYKEVNHPTPQPHPPQQQIMSNKGEMAQKLNYMIHLLEEQHDEKTGHVFEELILYSFLGIFIIFVVDSFARAGKYVR
jgi:hypothetical protein